MKKGVVLVVITLICFSGGLIAHKTGVVTNQQKDRTGSPVSQAQQCGQCHTNGNFGTTINLRLKDQSGNMVTEYLGGENYTFEVELNGSGSGYGFQAVALLAGNVNAGNFTVNSPNAKIMTLNNRKYAEQVTRSTTGLFVMNWQAPTAGSGTVNFYAAGNCVNANNTSSGDQAITASPLTINESIFSGINERENDLLSIYPNPCISDFTIELPNKIFDVEVFSMDGKKIYSSKNNSNNLKIDSHDWQNGMYIILVNGEVSFKKYIVKQ